jgi:hypothetical protein
VLDALDECSGDSRMELVDLLHQLLSVAARPVKVFGPGRFDRDIRDRLHSGPNVGVRATDNRDDIARFVATEFDRCQV